MTNARALDPVVEIKIGTETYRLKYTLWASVQFERLTGKGLFDGGLEISTSSSLLYVLWAGLITEHTELDGVIDSNGKPDATILAAWKKIGSALTKQELAEMVGSIAKVYAASAPKSEESEQKK